MQFTNLLGKNVHQQDRRNYDKIGTVSLFSVAFDVACRNVSFTSSKWKMEINVVLYINSKCHFIHVIRESDSRAENKKQVSMPLVAMVNGESVVMHVQARRCM